MNTAPILEGMEQHRGFVEAGLKSARDALQEAGARENLHLYPEEITRAATQRLRTKLRAIETLVRRLLLLLAAMLDVAQASPHHQTASPSKRCDGQPAPSGRVARFDLLPSATFDPVALAKLRERGGLKPDCKWTMAGPLLERFRRIMDVFDDPGRYATLMARRINRLKAAGGLPPICPEQRRTFRLGHELGLIATALPRLVRDALLAWFDTG
ncbi:MAG: hypothetical protein RIB03_13040 [Henriciella sp.]|uniref:hypothetical protein n=1 Tax=Henriciella sp. TaxID=1968823 RepID=UPI0032EEE486